MMASFELKHFTDDGEHTYKSVRNLYGLSVDDIKQLIFNRVYGIKYVSPSKLAEDKSIEQYIVGENKVVSIVDEVEVDRIEKYKSLVLVYKNMNEIALMNQMNSDIKRFNSILAEFMLF